MLVNGTLNYQFQPPLWEAFGAQTSTSYQIDHNYRVVQTYPQNTDGTVYLSHFTDALYVEVYKRTSDGKSRVKAFQLSDYGSGVGTTISSISLGDDVNGGYAAVHPGRGFSWASMSRAASTGTDWLSFAIAYTWFVSSFSLDVLNGLYVGANGADCKGSGVAFSPCGRYIVQTYTNITGTGYAITSVNCCHRSNYRGWYEGENNYLLGATDVKSPTWRTKTPLSGDYGKRAELAVIDAGVARKIRVLYTEAAFGTLTENTTWYSTPPSVPSGALTSIAWNFEGTKLVLCSVGSQPYVYDTTSEPYTSSTPSALSNIPTGGKVYFSDEPGGVCVFYSETGDGDGFNFHVFDYSDWSQVATAKNIPSNATFPSVLRPKQAYELIGYIFYPEYFSSSATPGICKLVRYANGKFRAIGIFDENSDNGTTSGRKYRGSLSPNNLFLTWITSGTNNNREWIVPEMYSNTGAESFSQPSSVALPWAWHEDSNGDIYGVHVRNATSAGNNKTFTWDKSAYTFSSVDHHVTGNPVTNGRGGCTIRKSTEELFVTIYNAGANEHALMKFPITATDSAPTAKYLESFTDPAISRCIFTRNETWLVIIRESPTRELVVLETTTFTESTDWKTPSAPAMGSGMSNNRECAANPAADYLAVWDGVPASGIRVTIWDISTTPWVNANITLSNIAEIKPTGCRWNADGSLFFVYGSVDSGSGWGLRIFDCTNNYAEIDPTTEVYNYRAHGHATQEVQSFAPLGVYNDTTVL